jgi:hypothetical protein
VLLVRVPSHRSCFSLVSSFLFWLFWSSTLLPTVGCRAAQSPLELPPSQSSVVFIFPSCFLLCFGRAFLVDLSCWSSFLKQRVPRQPCSSESDGAFGLFFAFTFTAARPLRCPLLSLLLSPRASICGCASWLFAREEGGIPAKLVFSTRVGDQEGISCGCEFSSS